jgi:DNA-binding MarR family transcriptional regulator
LSRGTQETRAELLDALARELRQLNGLSASFFRALAARIGVTVTDMQVIESLASTGSATAGQLADLTGLTTGAITGMLNRLEEAGLVRRETDPEDRRRVIVQLSPERDHTRGIGPLLESVGKAWEEMAATYDDEQIALLVDFLKRGNAVARLEIAWLREAPGGERGTWSAPLGELTSGQLVVSGSARLTVRAGQGMPELYEARFEGPLPEVKAIDGLVSIRYPRRLWMIGAGQRAAEVALSAAIPWGISIQGGGSEITAELGGLALAGLEVKGGMSMIRVVLPAPSGAVPIRISGGASEITVRRPAGVAARVRLKGWASGFVFDDQTFYDVGNDVRMQSPGYNTSELHYDIEVASSASMITITSD